MAARIVLTEYASRATTRRPDGAWMAAADTGAQHVMTAAGSCAFTSAATSSAVPAVAGPTTSSNPAASSTPRSMAVSGHLALLLAHFRGVAVLDRDTKALRWDPTGARLERVRDLTVGIVGFGRIGQVTARKLAAFGCTVLEEFSWEPLERWGTPERVFDDSIFRGRIINDGIEGCPLPVGTLADMRLVHKFEISDGLISNETGYECYMRMEDLGETARAGRNFVLAE